MTLTETELGLLVAGLALGGVILGGLVAGFFALLTGWLDSRREHKRWLREQRLEAYAEFARVVDRMPTSKEGWRKAEGYGDEIKDAQALLLILGPFKVSWSATNLMIQTLKFAQVVPDGTNPEFHDSLDIYSKAKSDYQTEAQKVLGINNHPDSARSRVARFFRRMRTRNRRSAKNKTHSNPATGRPEDSQNGR